MFIFGTLVNKPWVRSLITVAMGFSVLLCLTGAVFGVMFAFGKLYMKCPLCGKRSLANGGKKYGMWVDCPSCGSIRAKIGVLGPRFEQFEPY